MEFEHETYGKCVITDITQKKLEDYLRAMQGKEKEVVTVWRGDSVRIAAKQGLIVEPELKPEDIDNAKPAYIRWLSDECLAKVIAEVTRIDPLS